MRPRGREKDAAEVRDISCQVCAHSPIQFSRFHVDQIERLAARQQQEVRLKN